MEKMKDVEIEDIEMELVVNEEMEIVQEVIVMLGESLLYVKGVGRLEKEEEGMDKKGSFECVRQRGRTRVVYEKRNCLYN